MEKLEFKVGDKFWYVENVTRYSTQREVEVLKVGRVWVQLTNNLRCKKNGVVDGGRYSSPGVLYSSKGVYDLEVLRRNLWGGLREKLVCIYAVPEAWTMEDLTIMSGILDKK